MLGGMSNIAKHLKQYLSSTFTLTHFVTILPFYFLYMPNVGFTLPIRSTRSFPITKSSRPNAINGLYTTFTRALLDHTRWPHERSRLLYDFNPTDNPIAARAYRSQQDPFTICSRTARLILDPYTNNTRQTRLLLDLHSEYQATNKRLF